MRNALPIKARVCLGGLAFAGVAAAHWLAYLLAFPDGHERHEFLEATGHSYWPYFLALAQGVLVAGLASFGLERLKKPGADRSGAILYKFAAARLAVLQLAGFIALEAGERILSGAGLGGLFTEPVVLIGLVLQLLIAVVAAALLVVYAAGVERIARRRRGYSTVSSVVSDWVILRRLRPRLNVGRGTATLRGPPF